MIDAYAFVRSSLTEFSGGGGPEGSLFELHVFVQLFSVAGRPTTEPTYVITTLPSNAHLWKQHILDEIKARAAVDGFNVLRVVFADFSVVKP